MSDAAPHVVGLRMVCFDAVDPPALAGFWASLLGGEMSVDEEGDAWVTVGSGPRLDFLRVPEVKTLKNRLHLDVAVTDVALATTEALAWGIIGRRRLRRRTLAGAARPRGQRVLPAPA